MVKSKIHFFSGWGFNPDIAEAFIEDNNLIKYSWKQEAKPIGSGKQTLIAWSLGSFGLIRSLKNFANRPTRLCFINGFARLKADKDYDAVTDFALNATINGFIKSPSLSLSTFLKRAAKDTKSEYEKFLLIPDKDNISELFNGLEEMLNTDLRTRYMNVTQDVTVIISEKDKIVPYACGKYLADNSLDAKTIILSGKSHCISLNELKSCLIKEGFIN